MSKRTSQQYMREAVRALGKASYQLVEETCLRSATDTDGLSEDYWRILEIQDQIEELMKCVKQAAA